MSMLVCRTNRGHLKHHATGLKLQVFSQTSGKRMKPLEFIGQEHNQFDVDCNCLHQIKQERQHKIHVQFHFNNITFWGYVHGNCLAQYSSGPTKGTLGQLVCE